MNTVISLAMCTGQRIQRHLRMNRLFGKSTSNVALVTGSPVVAREKMTPAVQHEFLKYKFDPEITCCLSLHSLDLGLS